MYKKTAFADAKSCGYVPKNGGILSIFKID
jgi:hypothetical protein